MFNHYLITALRHFKRNKFTTAINVLCLAMGMACFAAAYGVIAWFTHADRHYANSGRTFFVTEQLNLRNSVSGTPSPATSWVTGSTLRANLPQLPAVARLTPAGEAPIGFDSHKSAFVATAFADPEFLEIFNLPFVSGDATNALQTPHSAVVTQAMAQRVFGKTDVVGRTLLLQNLERLTITGVVSSLKQPSHFGSGTALVQFEMLVSMDTYEAGVRATSNPTQRKEALETWGSNMSSFIYLLTPKEGAVGRGTLNDWLEAIVKNHAPTQEGSFHLAAEPISQLYSTVGDSAINTGSTGLSSRALLLILGGLILLVSCINYANLTTAQLATRAKEVAMRRIVGAARLEIIRQYLFETALLTLVAFVLIFIPVLVLLGILSSMTGADLLGTALMSGELWSMLLITLSAVTLIASAYPALVLSRLRPLQALRSSHGMRGPRFVPTLLVGIQFGAAGFLLIVLMVMQTQNSALRSQGAMFTGEPIVAVTASVREAGISMEALRDKLLHDQSVEIVTAADEIPGGFATQNHRAVGRSLEPAATRYYTTTNSVDTEYFKTMRIGLLAGRTFDPRHNDAWNQDTASKDAVMNVVINRALAEQVGWQEPTQAIGQTMYGHAGMGEHALTMRVIGVVETTPLALLGFGMLSNIYTFEPARATLPIIRFSKTRTHEGIAALEAAWAELSPNVPLRRVFLDEQFERSYRFLPMISNTFAGLALFAFFISAMGLIAMASHVTARRMREIGVRKTLGASVARVLGLLLRDFSKPVVIANVVMWPLAYIVMKAYLSMFMVKASLSAAPFLLGLAITVGIACASVGVQTTRAARLTPATVLRHE